jgi:hypothetical protein
MPGQISSTGAHFALDAGTKRGTGSTYLALFSAAPSDSTTVATMTEVTTAGYARQLVTWAAPSSDPSITSNTTTLTFGPFSADPPNVPYLALVSSASGTGGDFLAYWTADTARAAANGESIQVAAGGLTLSID